MSETKSGDRIYWLIATAIMTIGVWAIARYLGTDYGIAVVAYLVLGNGWNGRSATKHTQLASAVDEAVAKIIAARGDRP